MESEEYYILQLKDNSFYRNGKYCNYTYLNLPIALQTMDFYLYAVRQGVAMYKLPLCYEIFFEAVKYGMSLEYVNKYMIDKTMSLQYISSNPNPNLRFIPSRFVNEEFLLKAIELNQEIIVQIPKNIFTKKIYNFAIQLNGSLLKFTPKEFRTHEYCLTAINSPGWDDIYIRDIPFEQRQKEVCEAFMKKAKNVDYAVNYIPSYLKTIEFLRMYAEKDGNIILKFPKKFWIHPIWKLGVQSFVLQRAIYSKEFLEHCPDILLTPIRKLIQEKEEKETYKQKILYLFSTVKKDVVWNEYFPIAGPEFREIEYEDPITMESLQKGNVYAFYTVGAKKFLAGSMDMFKTFIELKSHNCTLETLFVPFLNKTISSIDLEWVVW
jgi:hypothetical protein